MQNFWQDLRFAVRTLIKSPGFTMVAVLTLALGIGANTAIFSLVNAVLLRQLPYRDPAGLVTVYASRPFSGKYPFSLPDFVDYRDQNESFEQIAAVANFNPNLTDRGEPERIIGARVSANLFEILGVQAIAGRALQPKDDDPGSPHVVAISYSLWQRRFGGDPNLVGQAIRLNGESYTVVGVLPRDFIFPFVRAGLAVPLVPEADPWTKDRGSVDFLRAVARLKPGVTPQIATAQMTALALRLEKQYPKYNSAKEAVNTYPMDEEILGAYRQSLYVLQGAVMVVLLITCSNLANLLLARANARHREIAIRTALGATRSRLVRQLLTESLTLSLAGASLGLVLAHWGAHALIRLSPAQLPRADQIAMDGRVLGFMLGIALLAGILFGLAPALESSRTDLNEELKGEGRGSTGGGSRGRIRSLLIVVEVALSLVLLIGAGLLLRSLMRLQSVQPGFDPQNVLTLRLSLPKTRYTSQEDLAAFYRQLYSRFQNLPGVESVGAINSLPMGGMLATVEFTIVGRPPIEARDEPTANLRVISMGYLQTMRIPLLAGRSFTEAEDSHAPVVALINETIARRYWPNGNPIGEHLKINDVNSGWRDIEIAGIVGDVKQTGLDAKPSFDIYLSLYQMSPDTIPWLRNNHYWVLRTKTDPLALAAEARSQVQAVDRDVAAASVMTMEQAIDATVAPRKFNFLLLMIFAGAALLLAAIGIYGVMAYTAGQRTREIGIRMALGAQHSDVLKLIVGQGMRLVLLGLAIGLIGAFALTRVMAGLLFNVSSTDPATFAGISALLAAVALAASWIPARRASKTDPLVALRYE